MSKILNKGDLAFALGKIHVTLQKVQKSLDELDITTETIDQAVNVILQACEKEINALKDRTS